MLGPGARSARTGVRQGTLATFGTRARTVRTTSAWLSKALASLPCIVPVGVDSRARVRLVRWSGCPNVRVVPQCPYQCEHTCRCSPASTRLHPVHQCSECQSKSSIPLQQVALVSPVSIQCDRKIPRTSKEADKRPPPPLPLLPLLLLLLEPALRRQLAVPLSKVSGSAPQENQWASDQRLSQPCTRRGRFRGAPKGRCSITRLSHVGRARPPAGRGRVEFTSVAILAQAGPLKPE